MKDTFEKPDGEGFRALLDTRFTRFGGMVFRREHFDPKVVRSRLATQTATRVQKELNHVDLILYATDEATQKRWAEELGQVWRQRLAAEFPDLQTFVEKTGDGDGVSVSFWSEGASEGSGTTDTD